MVMCLCVLLLLLLQMGILALQPVVNRKLSGSKGRQCQLFRPNPPRMVDIPLIPALICTTAGIFAIFNLENPLDLTDQGLAKARAQRRAEKLARGELPKSKEGLDPFRYKLFEDDDDEIDVIGGPKRGGGGCG